jgi:hypothetical protein
LDRFGLPVDVNRVGILVGPGRAETDHGQHYREAHCLTEFDADGDPPRIYGCPIDCMG